MMIPVLILHSVVRIIDRARQGHPRVFQFSLKKLLAAVIVIGLVCSSAGMRLRALAAIAAIGGDWNEDKVFLSGTKVSDSELRHLPWMGRVEVVWLCDANISDEGLQYFEQISELRALFIDNTRITDAGVAKLQALPLRWLSLNGTAVSDASVPNLARLTKLERLEVKGAKLTEAGLSRLTAALPLCQISR